HATAGVSPQNRRSYRCAKGTRPSFRASEQVNCTSENLTGQGSKHHILGHTCGNHSLLHRYCSNRLQFHFGIGKTRGREKHQNKCKSSGRRRRIQGGVSVPLTFGSPQSTQKRRAPGTPDVAPPLLKDDDET